MWHIWEHHRLNTVVEIMKINKPEYKPAKQHAVLTTGEVIKMLRELIG
jgi:hypothetical protein